MKHRGHISGPDVSVLPVVPDGPAASALPIRCEVLVIGSQVQCSALATVAVGVRRSCGCYREGDRRRLLCEGDARRMTTRPAPCVVCGLYGAATITEPVPLRPTS